MKLIKKITNGILLLIISIMHTQFALSDEAFGRQFKEFAKSYFYKISKGTEEMPIVSSAAYEHHAAFWFFYMGILLIPLGLLVHSLEKKNGTLPNSFTISYLIFVIIGSYMIPSSGMTLIMLPHAIYMLISNFYKIKKYKTIEVSQ